MSNRTKLRLPQFGCWIVIIGLFLLTACGSDAPTPALDFDTALIPPTTFASSTGAAASPAPTALPKPPNRVLMKDFIGVNQSYRLYEDKTERDFARVSKWLRDYVRWYCLQPEEKNFGGFDGTGGCGAPPNFFNYSAYYAQMQSLSVKIVQASEHSPPYANYIGKTGDYIPVSQPGLGRKPADFVKHAQHLYQVAGSFGGNKNLPLNNLLMPNPKAGQGFIQALQNWNEPDGSWKGQGIFTPEQYLNMLLADYDGDGGRLPLAGIKQADPNLKVVMSGFATNLDFLDGLQNVARQTNRKIPADVISLHLYATDGKTGLATEQNNQEELLAKAMRWRDSNVPDAEMWVTEFGWDTFAKGNEHSKNFAGEQNQANWILRSLVLYRAAGIDKAFVFMFRDEKEGSTESYASSGLATARNVKKISYYYLATMQDLLGDSYLDRAIPTGRSDVRAYLFREPNRSAGTITLWKTSGVGSPPEDFRLTLPSGSQSGCSAITPNNDSPFPNRTSLTASADGKITLPVSETMTFLACDVVG